VGQEVVLEVGVVLEGKKEGRKEGNDSRKEGRQGFNLSVIS
jgi:hypothetical protein